MIKNILSIISKLIMSKVETSDKPVSVKPEVSELKKVAEKIKTTKKSSKKTSKKKD